MRRIPFKQSLTALSIATGLLLAGCSSVAPKNPSTTTVTQQQVTVADAKAFIEQAEQQIKQEIIVASRNEWIYANFITEDTAALAAESNEKITTLGVNLANEAARYDDLPLDYVSRRKLDKLKQSLVLPAPQDQEKTAELAKIVAELNGLYGKGKYCNEQGECKDLGELSQVLATSRDYDAQLEAWQGWRTISPPMRELYQRQVELSNEGAQELGYKDLGAMWRSKYDMPASDFAPELDRLWGQVKPLYDALHCHVRAELGEVYGKDKVPQDKPIPAHLLGNMWAQDWGYIYPLVAPKNADPGYDVTELLKEKQWSEKKMVKKAEGFFTSMGFDELPQTFWERSLFLQPQDHDVVCHASAWNLDFKDDLRIKMCIKPTGEEFTTIHHELGHNFYQRAYNHLPVTFQESANDGFHEAIGDTIALSVTPEYLKKIGLLETIPDPSKDIGLLMRMAMEKISFVPFGLLVDQWRWQVFSGEVSPEEYNEAWWKLREHYQGVAAPIARSEADFDPGAKYHVPGNTPYTRYFLAHILQFQFHRALCDIAGNTGPIHRCSIYESKAAGEALNEMLEMGSSRPWQEALAKLTGKREMDATAILDYFAPLKTWLDEQNKTRQCGWK